MAIDQPHMQPEGAESITGAWTFSNGSITFPTVTRRVFLPAHLFGQSNGTGMSLTFVGTYPDRYEEWPFITAPGAEPQGIYAAFQIPQDYVSGGTWKVVYTQSSTDVNLWRAEVNVLGRVAGESAEAASETIAVSITPGGVAATTQVDQIGAGGTFAAGDWVRCNFERDSAHGDDTNPDIIRFIALYFEYTARESL